MVNREDVAPGRVYLARLRGKLVPVRVDSEVLLGMRKKYVGWQVTEVGTGRKLVVRTLRTFVRAVEGV